MIVDISSMLKISIDSKQTEKAYKGNTLYAFCFMSLKFYVLIIEHLISRLLAFELRNNLFHLFHNSHCIIAKT